jgi:hypothetical protein
LLLARLEAKLAFIELARPRQVLGGDVRVHGRVLQHYWLLEVLEVVPLPYDEQRRAISTSL